METVIDDWLDGGEIDEDEAEPPQSKAARGETVVKRRMTRIIGCSPNTIDKYIRDGCPIVSKGRATQKWLMNTADVIDWIRKHDVAIATGDTETMGLDAAKRREKEAQARLRELTLQRELGNTVTIEQVSKVYEEELTFLRSRLLAVPARVGVDAATQELIRKELHEALHEVTGAAVLKRESPDEDSE